MRGAVRRYLLRLGASVQAVLFVLPASAQEFQYSSDVGAIVQFSRDNNLKLSGRVCAPGTATFCDNIDFTGKNDKGKYILKFDELGDTKDVTIEYERKIKNLGPEEKGYSVWETTSPGAPDYLKTLRSPISKTDQLSNEVLQGWSGRKSTLVKIEDYLKIKSYTDKVAAELGYSAPNKQSIPIVAPRIEAASWDAIAKRVDKDGIAITNFGASEAIVYASTDVVHAAAENKDELLNYAANSLIGESSIIDESLFDVSVRSESLFDEYVNNRSDIGSIADDLIYFLNALMPAGACGWTHAEDGRFSITCMAHSDDYAMSRKNKFVVCIFSFIIGVQVDGFRKITISQLTRGGGRKKEFGPPPPEEFTFLPERDPDVASIGQSMRAKLKNLLNLRYPRSGSANPQ